MPLSLYESSIPTLRRGLENLAHILTKGAEHFEAGGVPESEWLDYRLIADMATLPRQIQMSTDTAKNLAARLGGATAPAFADEEKTVAELHERIAKTIAYIDSITADSMDGREDAEIVLPLPRATLTFTGASYLQSFALPNFFFHLTTAYAILRSKGVPLAKLDFLGAIGGIAKPE